MSIEKDINQPRFSSEYHKLNVNLIYTHNWAVEQSRKFFEKAGLTSQQYNILRILRGAGGPLTTMQIRERMLDRMSDTSRIVDRLMKKGLVEKKVCEDDRRRVDVTIAAKGRELLNKLDAYTHELYAYLSTLSEQEAAIMNRMLDKLRGSE